MEYRPVVGYESRYEISENGEVRSIGGGLRKRKKVLKWKIGKRRYAQLSLYNDEGPKDCYVHRLVAEAFHPNPSDLPQVHHRDENRFNNHKDNLEWTTNLLNSEASTAKKYILSTDDGSFIEVFNLRRYCRENCLDRNVVKKRILRRE